MISGFSSCIGQRNNTKNGQVTAMEGDFLISKIENKNSYFIIYGVKDRDTFKILSKKSNSRLDLNKIERNKIYHLKLKDFWEEGTIDKNPLTGFNSADPCFFLDEKTEICREKGVFGPYRTPNLDGLNYIKK